MALAMPYFYTNEEWYIEDYESGEITLTDKATPEAKESYEHFMKLLKQQDEALGF
jgi:hypothetical protein